MTTARCPHCGKPNAPVEVGCISRHRRADWVPNVSASNEVCAGGGLWLRVGERCGPRHLIADPYCVDQSGGAA